MMPLAFIVLAYARAKGVFARPSGQSVATKSCHGWHCNHL